MKLLNYTSLRYLLFTALLLFISIPVFYVVLNKIFIHAIDRDLYEQAAEIPVHQNSIQSLRDLKLWRTLDNDLEIVQADSNQFHDGPYTEIKSNDAKDSGDPFRILEKKINILGDNYIVRIKSSMIEKEDLVQTILVFQLSLLFLLLLGAVIINYLINKKLWRPFYQNLFFLQNFKFEDVTPVLAKKGKILEFNQLNRSTYELAISVRNAYFSQKEFTENASHEMQTPLSILKFKLELLLQESGLTSNQSKLIDDMYKVITQLEQLNKNLLLLSKMENQQFTFKERINVVQAAQETVHQLQFMADAKQQIIEIHHVDGECIIWGNQLLLKNLIKNLLRNAILYSGEKAIIQISIDEKKLGIENVGLPLLIPKEKLFSRFSRAGNKNGNGLGLAIAKKIADLHHFELTYCYTQGKHLFQIKF